MKAIILEGRNLVARESNPKMTLPDSLKMEIHTWCPEEVPFSMY